MMERSSDLVDFQLAPEDSAKDYRAEQIHVLKRLESVRHSARQNLF
jgi:hypothetical protein